MEHLSNVQSWWLISSQGELR
uniref:Uncharacterized protein n=1 Tax=Arundo donax TaxID=35708 RepID=A0A0A8Z6B7_ARUDO